MFSLGGGMIDIYYPKSYCISDAMVIHGDLLSGTPADEDFVYLYSATPYEPEDGESVDKYGSLSYHFRYNDGELSGNYSQVLVSDPDVYRVKRSDAYPVRCVFENSAPVVTDLSANQTANSYVVAESGFYEFKADFRGNGVTNLNVVSGDTFVNRDFDAGMGASISDIDHVEVLWWQGDLYKDGQTRSWWLDFIEDNPDSQEIEQNCPVRVLDDGKLADGKVLLYVTVNERTIGNVGLAAYDRNDRILWSWHIWIQPEISLIPFGDYTLMDRNLGATYSPTPGTSESFGADKVFAGMGLYYQWGRKDPFFQPGAFSGSSTNTSTQPWLYKEKGQWRIMRNNIIGSKNTISASAASPLTYFASSDNAWQTTYPSGNGPINDLWGYVGVIGTIGDSFAKTMYDPCPPGYRVMQHNVFETANVCTANDETTYTFRQPYRQYGIYLAEDVYSKGYIRTTGMWFPNARAINSAGNYVDSNYRLSTATPYSGIGTRELRWWTNDGGANYSIQQNSNHYENGNPVANNWMSDGRVVRCQME